MKTQERLKIARTRLSLTLKQVEQQTGIGISTISELENGIRQPRVSHLSKLARAYHVELSWFFEDQPIVAQRVLWRKKPEDGFTEAEAKFYEFCQRYARLEKWCGERTEDLLPREPYSASFSFERAEALANKVRLLLGLGDRPGCNLLRVIEEYANVKVFFLSTEKSGSAACARGDFGAAMMINPEHARGRRNFDIAHELYHLICWKEESLICDDNDEREEQVANVFASSLLIPRDAVIESIERYRRNGGLSDEAVLQIVREFDVSVEAFVWRLVNIYPAMRDSALQHIQRLNIIQHSYKSKDDAPPPSLPERYRSLAIRALRTGQISSGICAEYLGISRREAMKYLDDCAEEKHEITIPVA